MLPSITNVINLADSHDRAAFAMVTHVKQEPRERENSESKEEVMSGLRGASFSQHNTRFFNFMSGLYFFRAGAMNWNLFTLKDLNVIPRFKFKNLFFC